MRDDVRCPQHPNEAFPCRHCTDPSVFYAFGGEYFADAGDSVWSTCLCSYINGVRVLDSVCPSHNDSVDREEFYARIERDEGRR